LALINSWGRLTESDDEMRFLSERSDLINQITSEVKKGLAYGMGRSYGDSCLNPGGILWSTTQLDRFISFNRISGQITCEPGVLLRDIQRLATESDWMLAVTPGTQMITVGGAIANDVHGKNHHQMGNFGEHICSLEVLRTDGQYIQCGPNENADFFWATIGGLGLTGLITQATIQLRKISSTYLDTESIAYNNLNEFMQLSSESEAHWEYNVSWIDCSSKKKARGIFMRANHSNHPQLDPPEKKVHSISFVPPVSAINRFSLPILNNAYFRLNKLKSGKHKTHYQPFFYPLDGLQNWNRLYGPKGFYQYQSVIPVGVAKDATQAMLNSIQKSGEGSFLAVLKTFGNRKSKGMLSFPQPGITLAVDFPNNGTSTEKLFNQLDQIVSEAGGRLYPAKDARMPKALFEKGYPRLSEFIQYRDLGISSALSRRLIGS
jgi:FAD/FMN-containing dehydrogenase